MTDPSIRPLTKRNQQGQVYQRLPHVDQQIGEALNLSVTQLEARVRVPKGEDGHLQEETLVYLLRHARFTSRPALEDVVGSALVDRCTWYLNHRFRSLSDDDSLVASSEVWERLAVKLVALDDRGDFYQVRFWLGFKRLATTVFDETVKVINELSVERAREWDDPADELGDESESGSASVERAAEEDAEAFLSEKDAARLAEALAQIKEPYREAYILRFGEGWPIESTDGSGFSISDHFGRTPRTISTWLVKAREAIDKWLEEQS